VVTAASHKVDLFAESLKVEVVLCGNWAKGADKVILQLCDRGGDVDTVVHDGGDDFRLYLSFRLGANAKGSSPEHSP